MRLRYEVHSPVVLQHLSFCVDHANVRIKEDVANCSCMSVCRLFAVDVKCYPVFAVLCWPGIAWHTQGCIAALCLHYS